MVKGKFEMASSDKKITNLEENDVILRRGRFE